MLGPSRETQKDIIIFLITVASSVAFCIAINLASYVLEATTVCCREIDDTGVKPTYTSIPVIDHLLEISCAWSESAYIDFYKGVPRGSGRPGSISSLESLYFSKKSA